jgi:hypothetical protein
MEPTLPTVVQDVVAAIPDGKCAAVADELRTAAPAERAAGNDALSRELDVVAQVLDMMLVPSNMREAYRPLVIYNGNRSALPGDFIDDQLALLAAPSQSHGDRCGRADCRCFVGFIWPGKLRVRTLGIAIALQPQFPRQIHGADLGQFDRQTMPIHAHRALQRRTA